MATIVGTQASTPPRSSTNECGNAYADVNTIAVPVLAATDEVVLATVPAGVLLTHMAVRNTDLDTGATLTGTVGFRPRKANSSITADPSYFSAAFAQFQAAAGFTEMNFIPVKFNEPVDIVFDPSGAGTTAGTVYVKLLGIVEGVR